MRLTRQAMEALIPHAGSMCLLDSIADWDESHIQCVSYTHLDSGNPLRVDGRLPATCGIEYAAQAMALHGGLTARAAVGRPRTGYLASVRDLRCWRARLDDLPGELMVKAERLMGDKTRAIYCFSISSGGAEVISGRAAVVLDGG